MKQMIVEKILELPYEVSEIKEINAENSITYQKEEGGVRAIGNLKLSGKVLSSGQLKDFHEIVTLDILAPNKKLNRNIPFSITFHHYDAKLVNKDILIVLYLDLNGLKDDEYGDEIRVEENAEPAKSAEVLCESEVPTAVQNDTEQSAVSVLSEVISAPSVEAKVPLKEKPAVEKDPELIEEQDSTDNALPAEFEDLFDDRENTKVTTRVIRVLPHDSYTSIAERYGVDLKKLMEANRGKNIENCVLITLPND